MQFLAESMLPWSALISYILQNYMQSGATICQIWHKNFDLQLLPLMPMHANVYLHIELDNLRESFENDVYNFSAKRNQLNNNGISYDDLVLKLTVAIEHTKCEEHIPIFARAFYNASIYSLWRSTRTHFIFAYTNELNVDGAAYFEDYIFHDQANILVLEAESLNSSKIALKTNRFVGSLYDNPNQLILLDHFDTATQTFNLKQNLFPNKLNNLQGREIILGVFDYRPFVAIDFDTAPNMHDIAEDNLKHTVHIDGTEARILLTFCELYNCTVQGDTSEKEDWGKLAPNATANGLLGNIVNRRSHMSLCAMYSWLIDYVYLDLTAFLGRSGVTCMVPAPKILSSWSLPVKPFQFTLWLGVAGCLCLEILALVFTRRFEQTLAREDNSWLASLEFGYIVTLKLFISQGTDYIVNSTTVRTVLFACYMIDMIVTSIYSGGLAAVLTVPAFDSAPDSVQRLYEFGLEWSGSSIVWTEAFRHDPDPLRQGLLHQYTVFSQEQLLQRAYTDNLGLVVERMTFNHFGNVDPFTPQSIGRFKLMVDDIYFQWTVAFVPRLWAFLSRYNTMIYNIHSSGFSKYWEWKITADYMNANIQQQMAASQYLNPDVGVVPLGMSNFAGVIVIWIIGMIMSILSFAAELLYYKYKRNEINEDVATDIY